MRSPPAFLILGLVAAAVGVAAALFLRRVPMRGSVAVSLVIMSAVAWTIIEPGESSSSSFSLPMFLGFLVVAPITVVYAFRARRVAPDRTMALAGFVGSFVVGGFFLFMLTGIIYMIFER